jgi:hypothetical protein
MNRSVPLEVVETNQRCAVPIRAAVEDALLYHSRVVTLVAGRLRPRRPWQRRLHDQSAEGIVAAAADLERVRVDIVDVPV